MSTLPKLDSYQLSYEQIPLPKYKVAASVKQKSGRKGQAQLPQNVLDNV